MSEDTGTITIRKDSLWKYSTFLLLAVLVIGGVVAFTGSDKSPVTGNVVNTGGDTLPAKVAASADDDAFLGDEDAPVTVIEFSDMECPFCKRHHDQTFPSIKSEYIDTGKVKYVFRDFTPTLVNPSYHPDAVNAAMAAECVGEQGGDEAYFEMVDKIFANQGANSAVNLKALATGIGYDISECLDSEEMKAEVQKDLTDGQAAGVKGTPGFVINGQLVSGAQPFEVFKQVIDSSL